MERAVIHPTARGTIRKLETAHGERRVQSASTIRTLYRTQQLPARDDAGATGENVQLSTETLERHMSIHLVSEKQRHSFSRTE